MLSYLSSWFGGCSEDPSIILCKDVILEDSPTESGCEWVWVDVETCKRKIDKGEDLDNVLQEYIIIPPYPADDKQNSSTSAAPVSAPRKRSKRHNANIFKKKRRYGKLKIYPPLKAPSQYSVGKRSMGNSFKGNARVIPCIKDEALITCPENEQGFSFDGIKGFQGFKCEVNMPLDIFHKDKIKPKSFLEPLPEVPSCSSTLAVNTKKALTDSWYTVPEIHTYMTDNFKRLSTEGWSILIDSSGETLSSSMVRIWSIRQGHDQISRLLESLCVGENVNSGYTDNVLALLEKPLVRRKRPKRSGKRRKNRSSTNVLTAKPGHTSLIVKKRQDHPEGRNVCNHGQGKQITPAFSFSRGMNSLLHSSKDMLFALQVYLAQILDTVAIENHDMSSVHPSRKQQVTIPTCTKRADKIAHKVTTKKNGRKNLARCNATQLHRRDKAVYMRRKAIGRGGFNYGVKRSF